MSTVDYSVSGGLADAQLKRMHEEAIDLAERVGLKVEHVGVLGVLRQYSGVTVEKDRVKFRPDLVEKSIKTLEYPDNVNLPPYAINCGAYALNILDSDSGEIRKPTMDDLVAMTKLADSMDMVGTTPVMPCDLGSDELSEIAVFKTAYEHSRFINTGISDQSPKSTRRVADYALEMAQAAGKEASINLWITSPFRAPSDELEIIYHFRDKRVPMLVNTMPVMGTTAPIFLVSAYVQSMAELFAGITLLKLLNPGGKVYTGIFDSIRAYPFDMKYATFVYGSPRDVLGTMLQIQLNHYYGLPTMAKSLLTAATLPDQQAAAEKMGHTLMAALAGARSFCTGGLLCVDEVWSAEQAVIDYEIVNYVKHVVQGFSFDESTIALDAIMDGIREGNLLAHESTVANFRKLIWDPALFEHRMLNAWRLAGQRTITERAREIARKRIAEHDYQAPPEVRKELDRIYQRAEKELLGK